MTQGAKDSAKIRAASIQMLVLDVDGVLTDGHLYYSNSGDEIKAFSIKDGLGIKLLQAVGVKVAIITGRSSDIVTRRASELGIEDIVQGREDKKQALTELCQRNELSLGDCAYMGDDLPDLGAINSAGLGMTVADGCSAVRDAADWVSERKGGFGAVREACEFILSARGDWQKIESEFT
jgi:3-deoxy-D-manno-octulosonate 8-phosphate phosphatase (KDO 8-P phosphatase)